MIKRIAIYARCSTADDQTTGNQINELRAAAERHGWVVVAVFDDHGVSGSLARERRPAMKALLRAVDMVAAWAVDRLGRSLADLLGFLGELHAKQVDLYLHQLGLDTSTPAGRASGRPTITDITRDAICGLLDAGQSAPSYGNSASARAASAVCGPLWPLRSRQRPDPAGQAESDRRF